MECVAMYDKRAHRSKLTAGSVDSTRGRRGLFHQWTGGNQNETERGKNESYLHRHCPQQVSNIERLTRDY